MVYKLPNEALEDTTVQFGKLDSTVSNAFVPIGGIVMWSGTIAEAEALTNWAICDGTNSTPDLRDKFVLGVGSSTATSTASVDDTGGNNSITLTEGQMPSHNHNITDNGHSHTINNHSHSFSASGSNTHSHGLPKGSGGADADISNYIPSPRVEYIQSSFSSDNATITINVSGNTGNPSDRGTNSQGSSATNANLPPYYALCYIMKS